MKRSLAVLALMFVAQSASAQIAPANDTKEIKAIRQELKKCIDADDSNYGMKICTGEALSAADKQLNIVYKKLVTGLEASIKEEAATGDTFSNSKEILRRLREAQRAWVKFRDAESEYAASTMMGGSGEGLIAVDTSYELTATRTNELARDLQGN